MLIQWLLTLMKVLYPTSSIHEFIEPFVVAKLKCVSWILFILFLLLEISKNGLNELLWFDRIQVENHCANRIIPDTWISRKYKNQLSITPVVVVSYASNHNNQQVLVCSPQPWSACLTQVHEVNHEVLGCNHQVLGCNQQVLGCNHEVLGCPATLTASNVVGRPPVPTNYTNGQWTFVPGSANGRREIFSEFY